MELLQVFIIATLVAVTLATDGPYYPRPAYPAYPAYPAAYPKSYDYVSKFIHANTI